MQPKDEGQDTFEQSTAVSPASDSVTNDQAQPEYSQNTYVATAATATWQTKEFSDHQRPASWFFMYIAVSLVVIVGAYLLLRDMITIIALVVVALIFGFSVTRRPKELDYSINEQGLSVGTRHYTFDGFKCFYVAHDSSGTTISLQSMKKYLPPLSLRCPLDKEDEALEALSHYVPYEERDNDLVESLTHKFRF